MQRTFTGCWELTANKYVFKKEGKSVVREAQSQRVSSLAYK